MGIGIIAKKLGMTQLFEEDGRWVPVTVLQAGPCVVVARQTEARNGYEAVQLGLVESRPRKRVTKGVAGHFAKAGVPPTRVLREFSVGAEDKLAPGDKVLVQSTFQVGDKVTVVGTSKGKGFQGVVRRYHFRGGDASHGSMFHRAPGSIGASAYPSRVFPGTRMPGHMGDENTTIQNLKVVSVRPEENIILVHGGIPGAVGGLVVIKKAIKGYKQKAA